MKVSSLQRCLFDEILHSSTNPCINIILSGQVGCVVKKLNQYLGEEYLFWMVNGFEMGYYNYLYYPKLAKN